MKTKEIIVIFIATLVVLIAYGCFFQFHLVSDAYRIIDSSNVFMMNLKCNEGRLIQVFYFLLLSVFGFSINSIDSYMFLYRINFTASLVLLILSILLVYKMLKDNIKNITFKKKIILFICTLLMFVNISVSEYLLYIENVVLIFGLFLAIVASYIYHSNIKLKYIITPFLILISSFCYQGVAQIFVTLSALLLFLKSPDSSRRYRFTELLKILLLYLLPLIINYLVCWLLNSILPNIDPRVFTGVVESLKRLISADVIFLICIYSVFFAFLFLFNPEMFIKKQGTENLLNICCLMILSLFSFIIFIFNNSVALLARTTFNFIILYPILKVYIVSQKPSDNHNFDIIFTSLLLIANILLVMNLQVSSIDSTNQNIEMMQEIIEKIEEYEAENNIEIKNVAYYCDSSLNMEYWNAENLLYYAYTSPIYSGYWCDIYSINVLSGRKFNRIDSSCQDKEISDYFCSQNWDEPNIDEQVLFTGDTVHICKF